MLDTTVLNSALNIFLSITATLENSLILVALQNVSSLHVASKLLFQCLAVTDLGVGLITQPLYAALELKCATKVNKNYCIYVIKAQRSSALILCGVSLLTSTAISVDRLLVLVLWKRYRQVATLKRVRVLTISFWVTSVSIGLTDILWSHHITNVVAAVMMILCVLFSLSSYSIIYVKLRQHQDLVQDVINHRQPTGGRIPLNITRYKTAVNSIAWIQLTLVVCYVPFFVCLMILHSRGPLTVYDFTVTLLLFNSSINPVLYCWKMKEVRQAVKVTVRSLCCS
ncbi:5-hydroxytryptamine receptor 1B-like [Montipora capricornis]|uniref:5-hydroxytryptamine receptor 1B-like n=1 Tax=Montipora capricornis TaxID=246305 RepID=UPI0035F2087C